MTDDDLRALRTRLKAGEYDGADVMAAWIAIDELLELRWQPISSAPRDGTQVDLWLERVDRPADDERCADCHWSEGIWRTFDARFQEFYDVEHPGSSSVFRATHWRAVSGPL